MKISAFERFQEELKTFDEKLKEVSNDKVKQQTNNLIKKLKTLISEIDITHDANLNGYMNPHIISHKRQEIISTREKIYKLLNIKFKSRQTT